MTEELALKRLSGAFNPQSFVSPWLQDFLGGNLLEVCELVAPGERVQCLYSDTAHVNQEAKQKMLLDYVPVSASGTPLFGDTTESVATHFFITRPKVVDALFKDAGLTVSEPSASAMITAWKFIAHQVRRLVQVKCAGRLNTLPFSALSAYGVNPSFVLAIQLECKSVCDGDNLQDRALLDYTDRCSVSGLSSYRILAAIQREVSVGELHRIVAETVSIGI